MLSFRYAKQTSKNVVDTNFKGKLTNQTWENGKKPNFGSDFGSLGLSLGPQFFFVDFTSARS